MPLNDRTVIDFGTYRGIQQYPFRQTVGTAPLLNVLYVGEKLVEVVRMKPLRLELSTESLCVKFRIDNYRPFLISEAYVSFHDWKELWVLVFARRPVPINALSAH